LQPHVVSITFRERIAIKYRADAQNAFSCNNLSRFMPGTMPRIVVSLDYQAPGAGGDVVW
jgi:hypothetical protein